MSDDKWIQTASGLKFPLIKPDPEAILIEDIAHGLSLLCRFNGQCKKFYSVAEHSVHVSNEISPELALLGLMHDAAEAYLGDVPSPLKSELSEFKKYEDRLSDAIAEKFGFEMPDKDAAEHKELKRADIQLLVDEKSVLMVDAPEPWPPGEPPKVKDISRIGCWPPAEAKERFLKRFADLSG
ncbi:MAG: hypothetical protein K8F25_09245 [Fimbriimonadaceae bacterium]|nr:hypothetical protein [Alphaproteobacteria bacterium]